MGILHGRDLLSPKYTTAIITDSQDRAYFVPIKITVGDFFLAEINGGFYAFSLRNARLIIHRETLTRTFKFIQYDTSHAYSLKSEMQLLEKMLKKNMLPRMNMIQFSALKILGRKERIEVIKNAEKVKDKLDEDPDYKFEPHDIRALIAEIGERKDEFPEEVTNMVNYLESLDIDHIVTPVRKITEFIEDDLIATDPSFLGELMPRYQRVDGENRNITNKQLTGRKAWLMPMMVIMFIAMIGFMVYWAYDNGYFNSITSMFPSQDSFAGIGEAFNPAVLQGGEGNPYSDTAMQAKYTPEELRIAVDNGEVPYDRLSPTMKKIVDSVELPVVEAP